MSASKLRLFVAVDVPGEVRERISSALEGTREEVTGARWVKPQNLHLTLKFIGDYGEEGIARLSNQIHAAAARAPAFTAALGGCGAFPAPRRARVIWIGMARGSEEAAEVARKLDARLEKAGVKREERPFRGHLTLARLRQPVDCAPYLEVLGSRLEGLQEMAFAVEEVVLYRSILGPQGPTYVALERMRLEGACGEKG